MFQRLGRAAAGAQVRDLSRALTPAHRCLVLSGSRALTEEGARMWVIRPAAHREKPLPSISADPHPVLKSLSGSAGATKEAEHPEIWGHQTHCPFLPSREDTLKAQGRLQRWGPEQEAERKGIQGGKWKKKEKSAVLT